MNTHEIYQKEPIPVTGVEFCLWSADEIRRFSVCEVNESKLNGPGTVYDPAMGVTENRLKCSTCFEEIQKCASHFGHIELNVPICHPLYYNEIIQYLKCFCPNCSFFRMNDEQLELMNFQWHKTLTATSFEEDPNIFAKQQLYFDKMIEQLGKITFCPNPECKKWLPNYFLNDNNIYQFYGKKDLNIMITDETIARIFEKINQNDLLKVGISNPKTHPENLIITALPVLPPAARPPCKTDGGSKDDDLTYKYVEIIKVNNKLKQDDISERKRHELIESLKFHCRTLMDNSKNLAKQANNRPIKALKTRLNGKGGLIRWHLSGKRVDFSARSVIGPDPMLCADEIAVPHHIAVTQSFPERVYTRNINYLQNLIDNKKASYVMREERRIDLDIATKSNTNFETNDVIYSSTTPGANLQATIIHIFRDKPFVDYFQALNQEFIADSTCESRQNSDWKYEKIDCQKYFLLKNKQYELKPGDILIRNSIIHIDLEACGFNFKKNDILTRHNETYKIDACDVIKGSPVFLHKDKQESLDSKDVITRTTSNCVLTFGHISIQKERKFILRLGDIVCRHLQSGDYIAFGRQPTLHKGSLLARKIRIIDESNNSYYVKTIRMNLAQTKTYNSDFDGDEMNLYSSQSFEVAAEMKYLASTEANLKSGQNGRLLLSIHQDAMTGGYLMTQKFNEMNYPSTTVQLGTNSNSNSNSKSNTKTNSKSKKTNNSNKSKPSIDQTSIMSRNHFNEISNDFSGKCYTAFLDCSKPGCKISIPRQLFMDCLVNLKNMEIHQKCNHIKNTLFKFGLSNLDDHFYTGHSLFSFLFPDDFYYKNFVSDDNTVIIIRGVLLSGTLCKSVLGDSQSSVIHVLEKEYSSQVAMDFVTNYQFIINHWLLHQGFSVGMDDCVLSKKIDAVEALDKSYIEASLINESEIDPNIREIKILNALNSANNIGQKLCKESISETNAFKAMIESGSKGNFVNVAQIMGLLGQQNFEGGRIPKTYDNFRTLPHCFDLDIGEFKDNLPVLAQIFRSRGFVSSCFFHKLHPIENWFHCCGSREGVSDTAVKTSSTGYSQRKLIKFLEDLKFTYNDTITNAKDQIISFNYGHSNLQPSKLVHVNKSLQAVNIENLANKLNTELAFNKIVNDPQIDH